MTAAGLIGTDLPLAEAYDLALVDLDDKDEVTLDIAPLSKKERAKGTEPSAPEEEVAAD